MSERIYSTKDFETRTFPTSLNWEEAVDMIDFPNDVKGLKILDMGSGASNAVLKLREMGAVSLGIDPRYKNLRQMKFEVNSYLRGDSGAHLREKLEDLKNRGFLKRIFANTVKALISSSKNGYVARSEKAMKDFFEDFKIGNNTYISGLAENVPLGDNTVDFYFSIECLTGFVLKDSEAFKKAMNEAIRVVRPGGQIQLYPWIGGTIDWSKNEILNANQVLKDFKRKGIKYFVENLDNRTTRLKVVKS